MKRSHLVELEDLAWFPAILRDGGTAYLELAVRLSGHAKLLGPKLAEAMKASGSTSIVDLCSGGGGPVRTVLEALAEAGNPVTARLTDFYPNKPAFEHTAANSGGRITYEAAPVDATAVPPTLTGFRTIFNAFHHFRPDVARRILADAASARRPIGVFEIVSREPFTLVALLTAPLGVVLTMPLWRPFRWQWVLWTWLVPLMPLFVLWDGIVSWLRIYDEDELRVLVAGIDAPDYTWEIGRIRLGSAPAHATYLIGLPVQQEAAG
ncbi:MAG: class I SAM-dependent methyltransferase [Pseudomonadota bacterium]|nr:class I SAM-dependent methyltransferase [Pseudomonadota bacterium]